MEEIGYIVSRDPQGNVDALYRFWQDEYSHEEYLSNGIWIQDNSLVSVAVNLHNPCYDEISEAEAAEIAPLFGGKIEPVNQLQAA